MRVITMQASDRQATQLIQQADAELPARECEDFGLKQACEAPARRESDSLAETASQSKLNPGTSLQPSGSGMPGQRYQPHLLESSRYNINLAPFCKIAASFASWSEQSASVTWLRILHQQHSLPCHVGPNQRPFPHLTSTAALRLPPPPFPPAPFLSPPYAHASSTRI